MRTHGTLTKWNDDRGFGFISPAQGGDEIFIHISAFPRDGRRPRLNELISFETETGANGNPRAIRVMRPGQQVASRSTRRANRQKQSVRPLAAILGALVVAAIGAYAYSKFGDQRSADRTASPRTAATAPPAATFRCDGRTMCSQMTSCAEAKYFLRHCPNTKMDGNNDGEPCEQQWCY